MLMCITIVGIPLGLQHFKMAFGSKNGGICSRTAKKTPAGWEGTEKGAQTKGL